MPEPMVKQDGREKNEGERQAAKRCIVTLRQAHPPLKCIITEDRRSSHAPHIETRHDDGCHDLLGVKEGDPADLFNQVQAAQQAGRGTASERHDRAAGVVHRFRLVNDVPLTASRAAVQVHCLAYGESSQRLVWERLRALFYDYRLEAMREVLDALLDGFEKSHPLLITDTS